MASNRSAIPAVLALATVAAAPAQSTPSSRSAVTPAVKAIRTAIDALTVDLWGHLATGDGNVAYSPASIAMGLAMTTAGARGATQQELLRFLHVDDAALLPAFGVFARTLTTDATVKVTVANRLFGDQGCTFEPPFLELLARGFSSPLESLDLRGDPEAARRHVNDRVAEQTAQTIRDLLPPHSVSAATRLVLVNAMHFAGGWVAPFDPTRTRPRPFHLADDTTVTVPTMERTRYFPFVEVAGSAVVLLDYEGPRDEEHGPRGEFAMAFVLPPKDAASATWLGPVLPALPAHAEVTPLKEVRLRLPRFRVAPGDAFRLGRVMQSLGVKLAFSDRADLTGIARTADARERIRIDDVWHTAAVKVDEEGTEAAAATRIGGVFGKGAQPPRDVFFDRPFWFVLRHVPTGTVLFAGKVMDPR